MKYCIIRISEVREGLEPEIRGNKIRTANPEIHIGGYYDIHLVIKK